MHHLQKKKANKICFFYVPYLCYNNIGDNMNIYQKINEITAYIDDHLEEKIDYTVLAKMMGVNSYTMQRIFSLLTNINLSEYIRKRRLSCAGFDFYNTNEKIIDVALKYQYESATAFSRAFQSFHGINPSKITTTTVLKNFPRIILEEIDTIQKDMEYQVVERSSITLYGKGIPTTNETIENDAPRFFQEMIKKYESIYGEIPYGMISYQDEEHQICNRYYILYDKYIPDFEEITIPESKWLSFHIPSQEAEDIRNISQQFYLEFLPSCKYNLKSITELEYYHDDITDFLVAIE